MELMRMLGYILVVDDEPEITRLLEVTLNNIDLRTVAVNDGAEAVAEIEKETPRVILLDLMMPRVSGFKLLEYLHSNPRTADIPVIVISAYTNLPEARDLRAHKIMPKGKFGTQEIRDAVRLALGMT